MSSSFRGSGVAMLLLGTGSIGVRSLFGVQVPVSYCTDSVVIGGKSLC